MTFSEIADLFIKSRTPAKRDIRRIERLSTCIGFGDLDVSAIKPIHCYQAAHTLYPNCSNETKNRECLAMASVVLNFAAQNDLRPPFRLKWFKQREPETRRPADGTRELLLQNTRGKHHLLLALLFYQGWRISETLGLQGEHIDMEHRVLSIYIKKVRKWKSLPMHQAVYAALEQIEIRKGLIFPWHSRQAVYQWLYPLCDRLGVRFTPHMARHAFGSALHEQAHATTRDIRDLGTWTSERSVSRYVTPTAAHIRGLLDRLTIGRS